MKFKYAGMNFLIIQVILVLFIALPLEQPTSAMELSCSDGPTDLFQTPINSLSLIDSKADTFHVVVIGDSIAWGEGLKQNQKYYYLVAEWLKNELRRPVDVTVYAHNGATLKSSNDPQRCGECGSAAPSLFDQAKAIANPKEVDLILISGGINDVNVVDNIINSDVSETKIKDLTEEAILKQMPELLNILLKNCENSRIIITGYYPVLTEDTDEEIYYNQVYPKLHKFLTGQEPGEGYKSALIANSKKFHETSNQCLQYVVRYVPSELSKDKLGDDRVIFTEVNFPSEKCFGTMKHNIIFGHEIWYPKDESWLWSFDINWLIDNAGKADVNYADIKTNDQMYQYRLDNCVSDPKSISRQDIIDRVAAIAHPNSNGAAQYRDAIENAIREKGLNWLDATYKDESWISVLMKNIGNLLNLDKIEAKSAQETSPFPYSGTLMFRELKKLDHDSYVKSVAFSPDGTMLATASWDHTARIWDAMNGVELHRLIHDGPVDRVVFSPDGSKLATSKLFDYSYIWDVDSGRELYKLIDHGLITFSPDGSKLATADYYGNISRIWDTDSGAEKQELNCHGPVFSIAFSPDGSKLATASSDGTACIWDVTNGNELHKFIHSDVVDEVAFSPDSSKLATACRDGTAYVWDVISGAEVQRLKTRDSPCSVYFVVFSPDGNKLATIDHTSDQNVRIWEIKSGTELHKHSQWIVSSITFSPDGRKLLVAGLSGYEGGIILDVASGAEQQMHIYDGSVDSFAFSPNGSRLAIACNDVSGNYSSARIWELIN